MREKKVCKMQLVVERKLIAEDSEVRIYLSPVCQSNTHRTKALQQQRRRLTYLIYRVIMSLVITMPFAAWAITYAYDYRGYLAYGGEYLFILCIFIGVYNFLSK